MSAGHTWKRASDRATVCTSCGAVRLAGLTGGVTYYAPRPEVDQADLPVGREPPCEIGPFTISRLRMYVDCSIDVVALPSHVEPAPAVAAQGDLFGAAR